MYEERGLYSIPLGDEDEVVIRPQREENSREVSNREIMLRSVLVDDDTFEYQGSSYH